MRRMGGERREVRGWIGIEGVFGVSGRKKEGRVPL